MPNRKPTTMLNQIIAGLSRLLPREPEAPHVHPWFNEDGSWHSSSFELARGLEVIEHPSRQAVFADTAPAFQPPSA